MCVNVSGGGECAVSQPNLDLLHRGAFAKQETGTGVPEVMETDLLESILLNDPGEVFSHIIRS